MQLVREEYGGDLYEYYPLGQYVVAAPGVCGGRPSIKYTRIDARHIIGSLRSGDARSEVSSHYKIPVAAVDEAIALSERYDYEEGAVHQGRPTSSSVL